jgi:hypothetical protein
VPQVYLGEPLNLLKIHFIEKVAELVFNVDEVGSADLENRKTEEIVTLLRPAWTMCIISYLVATAMQHDLPSSLH